MWRRRGMTMNRRKELQNAKCWVFLMEYTKWPQESEYHCSSGLSTTPLPILGMGKHEANMWFVWSQKAAAWGEEGSRWRNSYACTVFFPSHHACVPDNTLTGQWRCYLALNICTLSICLWIGLFFQPIEERIIPAMNFHFFSWYL